MFSTAKNGRAMLAVKAAMDEWSSKTCVTFKRRTNEMGYAIFNLGEKG